MSWVPAPPSLSTSHRDVNVPRVFGQYQPYAQATPVLASPTNSTTSSAMPVFFGSGQTAFGHSGATNQMASFHDQAGLAPGMAPYTNAQIGLGSHFAPTMQQQQPPAAAQPAMPHAQGMSASPISMSASPISMSAHASGPGGAYDPIAAAVGLAADAGMRNRSYTPMPVTNAPMQPGDILNRRSYTPLPVSAAPVQPVGDILNRRSWTPVPSNASPMPIGVSVLPQPPPDLLSRSYTPMPAAQAVTAADNFLNRSYVPMPMDMVPVATPTAQPAPMPGVDLLSQSLTQIKPAEAQAPSPVNATTQPSARGVSQAPVPVNLNVYWQRPVTFDEHGRVVRQLGGGELTWGNKFLKDVLGVYHVGIEVYGVEYCFGNYHAPQAQQLGSPDSGVFQHEPQKPGPHCVFKQAVPLGTTTCSQGYVQEMCAKFGNGLFKRSSYKRIAHNCTDFARLLASTLQVGDLPLWCYRGAATAKALGLGGATTETKGAVGDTSPPTPVGIHGVNVQPTSSPTGRGHGRPETPPMRGATSARAAINRTVPDGVATVPGTTAREIIDRQLEPRTTAAYQAAAEAMAGGGGAGPSASSGDRATAIPNGLTQLSVGKLVSVFQNMGQCWTMARIASHEPDGTFTVVYEPSRAMEAGVAPARIVTVPEVPREETALAQAFHLEDKSRPGVISYTTGIVPGPGRPAAYQAQRGFSAPVQMYTGYGAQLAPAPQMATPSFASPSHAPQRSAQYAVGVMMRVT
eukprot:gnl/TRDRNA2_/TRDRNA2_172288_c0_seq2.p1 gnl/TRDRNA2_/TRDRNA2_172288_c0~~gnl/TRDRNA2_/TRDRNA2_172288_c0_seq2.p1  ORF type:complete len:743 (+),score=80.05 gnl/TRDRNA2_/TRDRNA2_172288_c0_seq2:67-2295(+)